MESSLIKFIKHYRDKKMSFTKLKEAWEKKVSKKDFESVTTERDLLKSSAETFKNDLEASKALNAELKKEVEAAKAESAKKDEKLSEVNKSLAEVLEKARDQGRVSTLVSEGVDKAKAEEIVVKFAKASDEMFGEIVDLYKTAKPDVKETIQKETEKLETTKAEKDEVEILIESAVDKSDELLEVSKAFLSEIFKKGAK